MSTTWQSRDRVKVSGGEVATRVLGDGPPIVLTHGTPASSYLWRNVADTLARDHTVYLWDMLGFGRSRIDPGVAPSIARQAATLAELVDHWRLESPGLVGHDIGGGVVARAHLIEGVPVRGLALVDAAVLGPWNTEFTDHMQRHAEMYRTMPPHVFADMIAARLRTATHTRLSDEDFAPYLAPWAGTDGQRRWIDQVAAVSFADTRDVVKRLDDIAAPALVLWGEQDEWLSPAVGQRLAAAIPGSVYVTIPGGGHFLPEDRPQDVARELSVFLA